MAPARNRVLALANQKGGVAKTTSVINLAASWAAGDQNVLMIDLDPQSSLTLAAGVLPERGQATTYDVLRGEADHGDVVVASPWGADLWPSAIDLARSEIELVSAMNRERRLADAVAEARTAYDWVVIDCPPSLGLLAVNALAAADWVAVPVAADFLAVRAAELQLQAVEDVRRHLKRRLRVAGLFATLVQRTRHGRTMLDELHARFGDRYPVLDSQIRHSVAAKDATYARRALVDHARSSGPAQDYLALAAEIDRITS